MLGDKQKATDNIELYLQKAKTKPETLKDAYFVAASIYSIMHDENNANNYLFNAVGSGYDDFIFLANDKDFDNVRESSSYKDIVRVYSKRKKD